MRHWNVTLVVGAGVEICIEVAALDKAGARREAKLWHPDGHIVHVEMVPGS